MPQQLQGTRGVGDNSVNEKRAVMYIMYLAWFNSELIVFHTNSLETQWFQYLLIAVVT
jgi:hypothetical protein